MLNIFKKSEIAFSLNAGKLKVEGLKKLPPDQADDIRQQIRQHRQQIVMELKQQEHDFLWQQAWTLANWIDNPGSDVLWQERTARVPELQAMPMMIVELEMLIEK